MAAPHGSLSEMCGGPGTGAAIGVGWGTSEVVRMGDVEEHEMVLGYSPLLMWGRSSGRVGGEELRKRWHHFLPWHRPVEERVSWVP